MEQKFIDNYHRGIELTELLFNYLKANTDYDISLSYYVSYIYYFKHSDIGQAVINIKINNHLFASICIHAYIVENDSPFIFHLWKYKGGDNGHNYKDISFCDSLNDDDFCLWCLDYINEFFGFNKINKGYKQLSLFDL